MGPRIIRIERQFPGPGNPCAPLDARYYGRKTADRRRRFDAADELGVNNRTGDEFHIGAGIAPGVQDREASGHTGPGRGTVYLTGSYCYGMPRMQTLLLILHWCGEQAKGDVRPVRIFRM